MKWFFKSTEHILAVLYSLALLEFLALLALGIHYHALSLIVPGVMITIPLVIVLTLLFREIGHGE